MFRCFTLIVKRRKKNGKKKQQRMLTRMNKKGLYHAWVFVLSVKKLRNIHIWPSPQSSMKKDWPMDQYVVDSFKSSANFRSCASRSRRCVNESSTSRRLFWITSADVSNCENGKTYEDQQENSMSNRNHNQSINRSIDQSIDWPKNWIEQSLNQSTERNEKFLD